MATLLQHSTFPQNEPWYLRAMASKSREEVGHTKEGQQHANRLESIAKMLEAAVEIERERDELRLRFSDSITTERQRCISAIPTTWLDPMLTGPNAVVGAPPYGCQDIHRLCTAITLRIKDAP